MAKTGTALGTVASVGSLGGAVAPETMTTTTLVATTVTTAAPGIAAVLNG